MAPRKANKKKQDIDLSDLAKNPLRDNDVLVLRTCNADMSSAYRNSFVWPEKGAVEAPDWVDSDACGHGLHGLPWGVGDIGMLNWDAIAKWLIVRVNKDDGYVEFSDKCKYRKGYVIYAGDRQGAAAILVANGAGQYGKVIGAVVSSGNSGTATAGYRGTATAGDRGMASAGDRGMASAGDRGVVVLYGWCSKLSRYIPAIGVIGENGLKPNTMYRLDDRHEFKEVEP